MSHIRKIEVRLTDIDALKKAFEKFGWTCGENEKINTYPGDPSKNKVFQFAFHHPDKYGYGVGVDYDTVEGNLNIFTDTYGGSVEESLGTELYKLYTAYNIEAAKNIVGDLEDRYEEPIITKTQDGWTEVCFEKI